jgi:hypothetical protein
VRNRSRSETNTILGNSPSAEGHALGDELHLQFDGQFELFKGQFLRATGRLQTTIYEVGTPRTHTVASEQLLRVIADSFYEVVDSCYATYCSLTARVLANTLSRLGYEAELLSCQLVGLGADRSIAIGFTGRQHEGKWDGHVVCATETHLLDAAVSHLELQAGIATPRFVLVSRSKVASRLYGLASLSNGARLLWSHAPEGFDLQPPEEPSELVSSLTDLLYDHLVSSLGIAHKP